jgi:hypothetical protein
LGTGVTRYEILQALNEQCDRNRRGGRSLQYDQARHRHGELRKLAVAIIQRDSKKDSLGFDAATWQSWLKEPYEKNLIRAMSLLVNEIERVTEEL